MHQRSYDLPDRHLQPQSSPRLDATRRTLQLGLWLAHRHRPRPALPSRLIHPLAPPSCSASADCPTSRSISSRSQRSLLVCGALRDSRESTLPSLSPLCLESLSPLSLWMISSVSSLVSIPVRSADLVPAHIHPELHEGIQVPNKFPPPCHRFSLTPFPPSPATDLIKDQGLRSILESYFNLGESVFGFISGYIVNSKYFKRRLS